MSAVDAHQHFWRLEPGRYEWLDRYAAIRRSFDESDLAPLLSQTGISRTILVQAENSYADTEAMLAACDRWGPACAVVGWVPLDRADEAAGALSVFAQDPRFVGVRHLIHDEPDENWLLRPAVLEGLRLVADQGLPFDVVAVTRPHLQQVAAVADIIPELTLVIDHLAAPPISRGTLEPWASLLADAASRPNVVAKVSGLGTLAGTADWTASDIHPYVERARELFGAARLMYGGDWPVSTLAGGYVKVWKETLRCVADWPPDDRERLFGGTAREIYKLPKMEGQ